MASNETIHLIKSFNTSLPDKEPVLMFRQQLQVTVKQSYVDRVRSQRPAKHKHHSRIPHSSRPLSEEAHTRRSLRHVPPQRLPYRVPVNNTLRGGASGEVGDGGVERSEDGVGEQGEDPVGGPGDGVLLLDHELETHDRGGEADGEGGVSSGADDDLGFELAEEFVGLEGGFDEEEREAEEGGEAEEGTGGGVSYGGDRREVESGGGDGGALHAVREPDEEDLG